MEENKEIRSKIEEVNLNGDKIFLKKGGFGWKVVYPFQKRYNDGKFNWKYFLVGNSWLKFLFIIGFVIIILFAIKEYYVNIKLVGACLRALPDYINLVPFIENPNLVNTDILNITNLI